MNTKEEENLEILLRLRAAIYEYRTVNAALTLEYQNIQLDAWQIAEIRRRIAEIYLVYAEAVSKIDRDRDALEHKE